MPLSPKNTDALKKAISDLISTPSIFENLQRSPEQSLNLICQRQEIQELMREAELSKGETKKLIMTVLVSSEQLIRSSQELHSELALKKLTGEVLSSSNPSVHKLEVIKGLYDSYNASAPKTNFIPFKGPGH